MPSSRASHIRKVLLSLLLLVSIIPIASSNSAVQPQLSTFQAGSYEIILKRYLGRPFLMVLWSLDCPPCFHELTMLGKLIEKYSEFELVLISTDSPGDRKELLSVINDIGIASADIWVFSQANSSRLRFEVDKVWYGELPRSYFFDGQHNRRSISGILEKNVVEAWIKKIP